MPPDEFLGFDVGNTRVKAGLVTKGQVQHSDWSLHTSPDDLDRLVNNLVELHPQYPAVVSTVNTKVSDRLLMLLQEKKVPIERLLLSDGSLFANGTLGCGIETPQTTGVDRILSAIAALERSEHRSVIVVDCGSAVTVNLTSVNRVFQGGAILPGLGLMAAALHRGTALLPQVPVGSIPDPIGRSTSAAISAGIYYSIVGAIDRLIAEISTKENRSHRDFPPEVHVTGGASPLLSPGIKTPHVISPNLVLEGLWYALYRKADA
jgi:type III pantothenate kinase